MSDRFIRYIIGCFLLLLLVLGHLGLLVDAPRNAVVGNYRVDPAILPYHKGLFIADWHADSLLWNRNLLARNHYGQLDLPRLREGNVALQYFTVVTKSPKGQNVDRNEASATGRITALVIAQTWPVSTWSSLKARAVYQAKRLQKFSEKSRGELVLIRSKKDFSGFLAARKNNPQLVAAILGLEGAHALEGKLENVDEFFDLGYRMIAPVHFFDNKLGGSAHGITKGGLSEFGRQVVARLEQKGIIVDLAHASEAMILDILAIAKRPVVVSHTGVRGTCNNQRNLSDKVIRAIAQNGGLIAIAYFAKALCGTSPAHIVKAIKYTADLAGVRHVALGSDYDGSVKTGFDTSGLALVTAELKKSRFTDSEIAMIMGENTRRLTLQSLPDL